jgi:hypothetical protein
MKAPKPKAMKPLQVGWDALEDWSMPNFVTFDDGLNYVSISEIDSFGYDREENNKGGTWIKLRNGDTVQTPWKVSKIAELLGPVANLHY